MTTLTADEIVKQLGVAGIKATPYKRGPLGNNTFAITLSDDRKSLRFHPGIADITITPDKKNRQVVISVIEKQRKITRVVKTRSEGVSSATSYLSRGWDFPVSLPRDRTTYTVTDVAFERKGEQDGYFSPRDHYSATVTATVRASRLYLLVGTDEEHLFICALPKKCQTVAEAHEALRPKNVPVGSPRQGEWFFVPVDEKLAATLDSKVKDSHVLHSRNLGPNQWDRNAHVSTTSIRHRNQWYVCGFVVDNQRHHDPLWLNDWHTPVHNLEVNQFAVTTGRAGGTWD